MAADRKVHTVVGQATRILHAGEPALLGVVIDVTDHRQAEAALLRDNRLLRSIGRRTRRWSAPKPKPG